MAVVGFEQIYGGIGKDTCYGGVGPDLLYGEEGEDVIQVCVCVCVCMWLGYFFFLASSSDSPVALIGIYIFLKSRCMYGSRKKNSGIDSEPDSFFLFFFPCSWSWWLAG